MMSIVLGYFVREGKPTPHQSWESETQKYSSIKPTDGNSGPREILPVINEIIGGLSVFKFESKSLPLQLKS